MKSFVAVNTAMPTADDNLGYLSSRSLRDYDIALISLKLPYLERVHFSGGGSCLAIESTQQIQAAMSHWRQEILGAMQAGKTIFVLLSALQKDLGATGSVMKSKNQRTYNTCELNNYQVLPARIDVKNAKGRKFTASDSRYRGLLATLKAFAGYEVLIDGNPGRSIFSTRDGATVGSVVQLEGLTGHLVLLPYFNLAEYNSNASGKWSAEAQRASNELISHFVAIDRTLNQDFSTTPPPAWLNVMPTPKDVVALGASVDLVDQEIAELNVRKEGLLAEQARLQAFTRLLYENGSALESAIEESLRILGFTVENFRDGDLEIDHVITGSAEIRMIGESEGKDTSAIDIAKFRQLETNINEDFEREGVKEHAKGILFGNGFRFTPPNERGEQFTEKCLKNAQRLGTALVRTSDLYKAIVYMLDHPDDEAFREACRKAIETTSGGVVQFPKLDQP